MPDNSRHGEPRRRDIGPRRGPGLIPIGVFSLIFAAFVAGGLYFGYIFVNTAVSVLTGVSREAAVPFLPANPFQPSGGPSGQEQPVSLPDWNGQERLNILLLGIDQREAERGKPSRTDTMIVLTIDPIAKTATLLSIPRDLWVVVPGQGEDKINTAHFYGEWQRPGSGPPLAKKTVETAFGVRIHYYARVDFSGFEKLVDTVGGITLDAPKPIKDDEYPEGDYGIRRIYIPAGLQRMDGRMALEYARSRHADNDVGRGQRQSQVLVAAKAQAMRLDLIPKLPLLLGVLRDAVSTDVSPTDMLGLINLARQIDTKAINSRSIDWTMVNDLYGDGTVLMPNWDRIRPLIAELFDDPRLKAEAATIEVQNGTLRDGLAAGTGGALNARGYEVRGVSQADRNDYSQTVILDHAGKKYTVQKLADLLNVPRQNVRQQAGGKTDITIILGQDAKVP